MKGACMTVGSRSRGVHCRVPVFSMCLSSRQTYRQMSSAFSVQEAFV